MNRNSKTKESKIETVLNASTYSVLHLCANVLLQIILGGLLEIAHKWHQIATIYIGSVIGGSLFITLLNPNNYAVGASAGVYGLISSHVSTIILNWSEMEMKFISLPALFIYIFADVCFNIEMAPNDLNVSGSDLIHQKIIPIFVNLSIFIFSYRNRQITPVTSVER